MLTNFKFSLLLLALALGVFTFFRLALLVLYPDVFSSLSITEVVSAFFNGIRFDLSILITLAGFPLLMINLPLLKLAKKWVLVWSLVYVLLISILTLVLIGDLIYFDMVKRHLSKELLLMSEDIPYVFEMASHYIMPLLVFLLFISALFLAVYKLNRKVVHQKNSYLTFLIFLALVIFGMRGHLGGGKPINVIGAYTSGSSACGNLILNGCFSAYHYSRAAKKKKKVHFYKSEELLDLMGKERAPFTRVVKAKYADKKNIVFILLESWSSEYIGALGAQYQVTPNFDALSKEGTLYTNFYAAGQRSIEGIQASLASVPPYPSVLNIGFGLEVSNFSRIASMAQELNYQTLFIQSSNRRSFRMDSIAQALGFEQYYGKEDIPLLMEYEGVNTPRFGWDYDTLMFLDKKINETKKPFLSFAFTGTTHIPYPKLPKKFQKYEHQELGQNGFLNTLYYADYALGEFMKKAKQKPWFKDTIFILTADHVLRADGVSNYKNKFHIPLLIINGEDLTASQNERYYSQLDLMPTMAQMIGYTKPFSAYGESIYEKKKDSVLANEAGAVWDFGPRGYLQHSTKNVLASSFDKETTLQEEKKLLSNYQYIYEQLDKNTWSQ